MKKIIAVLLCVFLLLPTSTFASFNVNIESAYNNFKAEHNKFVTSLTDCGVSEETLLSFIYDVYSYLLELEGSVTVTEANFESIAMTAVSRVSAREKYYPIQDALLILYPDAIRLAVNEGKISAEIQPLINTVKKILFENKGQSGSGDGISIGGDVSIEEPIEGENNPVIFTDISNSHWAYEAVSALAANFILNGYLDGTFRPDANITRGEFAKIIISATDTLDTTAVSSFTDVPEDKWYYAYVSSALKNGYITGYPDGTFRPEANITRADICTIVYRCLDTGNVMSGTQFTDDMSIPSYAKLPVYSLVRAGVINGMGNGSFAPLSYATRAQTAKIIYSAFFN